MSDLATMGSRLAFLMASRGESTRDVARATGVSAATIWRITQDKPAIWANVCSIADHYHVTLDWLRGAR